MTRKPLPMVAARLRKLLSQRPDIDTQEKVAELIGRSTNAVSKWFRGESQPRAEDVWKLCDLFQVSADFLIGRADERSWLVDLDESENPTSDQGDWAFPLPRRLEIVDVKEVDRREPSVRQRWRDKNKGKREHRHGDQEGRS